MPLASFAFGIGTTSEEVRLVQKYLNDAGYAATVAGQETNYFGSQTEAALARYQVDHAAEILNGPGVINNLGTFDPLTRRHLFGVTESVLGITSSPFLVNLTPGMSHPDVLRLQQYLNSTGHVIAASGPGSPGQETLYYGPGTQRAVKSYQESYASQILTPVNLTSGSGLFLAGTRNHMNAKMAASPNTVTTQSATKAPIVAASESTRTLTTKVSGPGVVVSNEGYTCSSATCAFDELESRTKHASRFQTLEWKLQWNSIVV
jgi:peptidoglycan hydrolase-like protein with peptidoglycan-binding domain